MNTKLAFSRVSTMILTASFLTLSACHVPGHTGIDEEPAPEAALSQEELLAIQEARAAALAAAAEARRERRGGGGGGSSWTAG
jgi:hypothetical protein